ncbi:hypothetical protein AX769_03315 [Frondihabitans sp. PAMC 28766]|uniref:hypothetical protein n=1 Tax=Frondihabitans sp. PAMC 28766 TaxID=1795630 RepID=UPI00078D7FF1|nr:hypothetical protein [Frondihabitans sp. PAMC 28766]AMM19338.1 hypothetical protein AX769_03315 [Frondihabitans sp. PAMC 28766]
MARIVLEVPRQSLPELTTRAVASVPRANLIEVSSDGALISYTTNFVTQAQTTRFTFHDHGPAGCEIRVAATAGGIFGGATIPGALLETGRAVLDALEREAAAGQ